MPNKTISELTTSGALTGAEELPIAQSGITFKTLLSSIKTFILGGLKTSDLINDGDDGVSHFITLNDLPSSLTLYATNAASDISGYFKLVTAITDPSYNTTAVNIPTGAITTTNKLIASLATSANIIVGNPGVFNITTIGQIQKLSGTGNAEFYFEVWKRVAAGTETLITTSAFTLPVLNSGYAEFSASALWNDGVFISTDRIVLKFYGSKVAGGGSNPSYQFQFGGLTPVRSLVPIPLNVTTSISGTTNYISKFTSSTTIGNSQIFDNGTNVGIGTASPTANLNVKASAAAGGTYVLKLDNSATSDGSLFNVRDNGNVGVNYAATNDTKFFINGGLTANNIYAFRVDANGTGTLINVLNVKNNGDFGVGTVPGSKFFVRGSDGNIGINFSLGATNGTKLYIDGGLTAANEFAFRIDGDGNQLFNIKNNGNIGIGNSTPTTKLDILSAALHDSGLRLRNLTSASPVTNGKAIGVDANGKVVTVENNFQSVTSGTQIETTSNTDVVATGLTFTPPAGTYKIDFNGHYMSIPGNVVEISTIDLQALTLYINNLTATGTHGLSFGSGETLTAGVYDVAGAMSIAGTLTLNGGVNDIFVFRSAGALNTASFTSVLLTGGVKSANVFFLANGALGLGANNVLNGNFIADGSAGALGANATFNGRLFSTAGSIAFGAGNISKPTDISLIPLGILDGFLGFTNGGGIQNTALATITGNLGTGSATVTIFTGSVFNGVAFDVTQPLGDTNVFSIYKGNTQIPFTERKRYYNTYVEDVTLIGTATVDGTEPITVRWRTDIGRVLLNNRIFTIQKIN